MNYITRDVPNRQDGEVRRSSSFLTKEVSQVVLPSIIIFKEIPGVPNSSMELAHVIKSLVKINCNEDTEVIFLTRNFLISRDIPLTELTSITPIKGNLFVVREKVVLLLVIRGKDQGTVIFLFQVEKVRILSFRQGVKEEIFGSRRELVGGIFLFLTDRKVV